MPQKKFGLSLYFYVYIWTQSLYFIRAWERVDWNNMKQKANITLRAVEWNIKLNENDFTIIITKNHMKTYLMKNWCKNFRQLLKIWQLFSAKSIRLNTSSIKRGLLRMLLAFFFKSYRTPFFMINYFEENNVTGRNYILFIT